MKRTIISTMCIVAALVLASSCNKIEEISDPGDITNTEEDLGRTIINGVVESIDTKAELSYGYDVLWNTGDKIYVTTGTKDDTFTLSKGEGTTSGQFTEDNKKGITGSIEAFYPASLKTDDGYVWPAIQTNNQVSPMYAKQTITGAEGETVNFSSLGAMLQIWFTTETNDIILTSITLKDGNKPLSGKFTVTDGQAVLESNSENPGVTLDLGDGVPIGLSPKCFYIAIPAGKYNNLTITFNSEDGKVCEMNSRSFPEVRRNTVGKLTLTGSFEKKALGLPGIFSISDKSRVQFSRGNLYCIRNGDSFTFAFESNQYDYRCRAAVEGDFATVDGKRGLTPSGTSGLFQWVSESASDNNKDWDWKYGRSLVYGSFGSFSFLTDEDCAGKATDVVDFSCMGDGWNAPSYQEWQYLASQRTNANLLIRRNVSVNGVTGAILAPDDWDTTNYPIVGEGSPSSYDKSMWSKMESMGLVFIPNAGFCAMGADGDAIPVIYDPRGGNCGYWSSNTYLNDVAVLYDFYHGTAALGVRNNAYSVRLVSRDNVPLTVTFDMNGHGTAPADITGVQYKSKINEPVKPSVKNCLFDGWYKEASCTNKWDFENDIVTEDVTLYAKWIELPAGVLSGMFTVAEGKQVHFSQGNLWYGKVGSAQTATFNFEENQYGTHGYDYTSNTWGLFSWSTSTTTYGMSTSVTNSDYSGNFVDWGKAIDNNGTWRTLSKDEWGYLFNGRDGAANKYGYATVSSKVGLIILPDEFTDPMKNSGSNAFVTGVTNTFASNLYSPENWAAMESAGAIFLPAAERRYGTNISADQSGSYWSSSASSTDTDKAYYLFFNINNFNSAEQWDRFRGFSVRLVTDVK